MNPQPRKKDGAGLYILPQHLAKQTKPTGHIERYGLTAVVPILTGIHLPILIGRCTSHHLFPFSKLLHHPKERYRMLFDLL